MLDMLHPQTGVRGPRASASIGSDATIFLASITNLARIRDRWGGFASDMAVRVIGHRLVAEVPKDIVLRYEPDTFLVAVGKILERAAAEAVAGRIIAIGGEPSPEFPEPCRLVVGIGLNRRPTAEEHSIDEQVAEADRALGVAIRERVPVATWAYGKATATS